MSLKDFSLIGKKALVVGARRNMGKAFALGLAEAGADETNKNDKIILIIFSWLVKLE